MIRHRLGLGVQNELMKKLIVLFAALSLFLPGMVAGAQVRTQPVHPDEASYKIEGKFSYNFINGEIKYKLTGVKGTGLTIQTDDGGVFRNTTESDVFAGVQIGGKEVRFVFENIKSNDDSRLDFENIAYWYYDPDIEDWQVDSEIEAPHRTAQDSKDLTLMLIIDCSSSLRKDIAKVKEACQQFLAQIYKSAPGGNLHVGIIAFSSMPDTEIYPMTRLDADSFEEMNGFIENLDYSNGTALFYAWDKAVEETEKYIESGKMHKYDRSYFITFTDGIDQTSQDLSHQPVPIVSADDYYDYIIKTAKKRIKNYESDVVFVKGSDITNERQQEKFENKLMQLAVPGDEDHYERLESIDNLSDKFESIARRLTDSWQVLNCYVAPARHGKVCWTFGKKKKKNSKSFVGLNVGVGYAFGSGSFADGPFNYTGKVSAFPAGLGIDCAWPTSDKFALGFYASFNLGGFRLTGTRYDNRLFSHGSPIGNTAFSDSFFAGGAHLGLLMLFGNINESPFILGISPLLGFRSFRYRDISPCLVQVRLGGTIGNHFYYTGYFAADFSEFVFEPGVTLGYRF